MAEGLIYGKEDNIKKKDGKKTVKGCRCNLYIVCGRQYDDKKLGKDTEQPKSSRKYWMTKSLPI